MNAPNQKIFVGVALAGVLAWSVPHVSLAQTLEDQPLVFKINSLDLPNLSTVEQDYLGRALAADVPALPEDSRVPGLRAYLLEKKSPFAGYADVLLKQYHYRLILGVSFAESNFCKHQIKPNNCWGIGGGRPETYKTLADGIVRANNLIQKYQDLGMTKPKLMRNSWVGWENDNWIIAVNQITKELEARGL